MSNKSDIPFEIATESGSQFAIPANSEVIATLPDTDNISIEIKNLYIRGTESLNILLK